MGRARKTTGKTETNAGAPATPDLPPDELRFLAEYDAGRYPRPSVSVDVALITADGGHLLAMLVERKEHPAKGRWALPGGFIGIEETLEHAAARVLEQEAGITGVFLEQLYTFGQPHRDPRTRVISVAYYALVEARWLYHMGGFTPEATLAVLDVPWKGEKGGPVGVRTSEGEPLALAFDHDEILGVAVKRLRGKLTYAPLGFELLPKRFTLRELQQVYETVLGKKVNKDSFRRSMLASGRIVSTGRREESVGHRPAELYRFRRRRGAFT